jgi:hypothetical protein
VADECDALCAIIDIGAWKQDVSALGYGIIWITAKFMHLNVFGGCFKSKLVDNTHDHLYNQAQFPLRSTW